MPVDSTLPSYAAPDSLTAGTLSALLALQAQRLAGSPVTHIPIISPSEIEAPMLRGQYHHILPALGLGGPGRDIVLLGPTGCGKSTFGPLEARRFGTVLIVCPTPVNLWGTYREHRLKLPNLVKELRLDYSIDVPELVDYSSSWIVHSGLQLTTYKQLEAFIVAWGCYPPVDVLFLDEYHQTAPAINFIRNLAYVEMIGAPYAQPVRVLSSATPLGRPATQPRMDGLQIIDMELPDVCSLPVPPIYRRSLHQTFHPHVMYIPTDSPGSARTLAANLRALGESVQLITEETSVAEALVAYSFDRDTTFVSDQVTSTGITLPCSLMVNPGLRYSRLFEDSLLFMDTLPLDPNARNQVLGRGGRVCNTVVYNSSAPTPPAVPGLDPISKASAYISFFGLCGFPPPASCLELSGASADFPKLSSCRLGAFVAAAAAPDPVSALFTLDSDGVPYVEFGGSALTLAADNASSLKVFSTPTRLYYGAFLDLTVPHDLSTMSTPAVELAMSSVLQSTAGVSTSLSATLPVLRSNWARVRRNVWDSFLMFHKPSSAPTYSVPNPSLLDPEYLFGSDASQLWSLLAADGASIVEVVGPAGVRRELRSSFGVCVYGAKQWLVPNTPPAPGSHIDAMAVSSAMLASLSPILVAAGLLGTNRTVDLSSKRHLLARSSNPWFNANC